MSYFLSRGLQSDNRKEAFRGWFAQLGELRSYYPNAPLLALSATCSLKIRKKVMKVLNVNDPVEITLSPNKSNIKLIVKKVSNSVEMALLWLIDGLIKLKDEFPKTLIYSNSIKDASMIRQYILTECPDCVPYVEMFHSESADKTKDRIISALGNSESELRIIIATTALGMGVDIRGFHSLIMYGPPQTTVDLIQGIGRLGRDGSQSCAILLHNSFNIRHIDLDVKCVIRDKNCRRLSLMKSFLKDSELDEIRKESEKHTCCDICEEKCQCGDCQYLPVQKLMQSEAEDEEDDQQADSESDLTEVEFSSDLDEL
jgi:superfamily II DNA helicase RecQ